MDFTTVFHRMLVMVHDTVSTGDPHPSRSVVTEQTKYPRTVKMALNA